MLRWCSSRADFTELTRALEPMRRAEEARLATLATHIAFCRGCGTVQSMKVPKADGQPGQWANLLEGLSCPACGLNGRMRKFCAAFDEILQLRPFRTAAIFERVTPLFRVLAGRVPDLIGCEYLGPGLASGSNHRFGEAAVRHEDISAASFGSESLDMVMHCDVLEHVPDMRTALSECLRILRPSGILAFTCPFYHNLTQNLVRARIERGAIRNVLPPVYHGNPVTDGGALVYTHPGWETFDLLTEVGFERSHALVMFDSMEGVVTNGCPFDDGHVWPVVFVAQKASYGV